MRYQSEEHVRMEVEFKSLKHERDLILDTKHKLEGELKDQMIRVEGLRKEIDLLSQDKNFLSRENNSLSDKLSNQERKVDRLEQELLESKKTV